MRRGFEKCTATLNVVMQAGRFMLGVIFLGALGLLGGEGVQTSVKFVKVPSPHRQPLSQWERVAEATAVAEAG